ncbi:MAG: baseplate protein [Candidatus Aminicenantes bacterium]|nr:baseplate protein [Candidatus Aminicenantes bacterium]NIM81068.1 baseplate protein [Candidatus Aminicenantes bacterium]NIN20445.1 baseplate protein [Candidatus Aminicenantes bacterium]NIN44218.1 baseplate protein [Candidatus Aminicenantes bacterium]NIN87036.1 baseplate protein [Candidatus Aminicenantes bacterium]
MAEKFLGTGWAFPLQVNALGQVSMSQYEQDIKEAIWIILSTRKGERVMRPDFGCGIHDFVFAVMNTSTLTLVENSVREALTLWEPRIEVTGVKITPGDMEEITPREMEEITNGKPKDGYGMAIDIEYKVRTTNNRFNLVYPFYLKEGR